MSVFPLSGFPTTVYPTTAAKKLIKENIEYDHLLRYSQIDPEELDGIVELLVETVCTARKSPVS